VRQIDALSVHNRPIFHGLWRFRQPLERSHIADENLDINAPRKVLNIEWDDDGYVEVVSYKRGDWEASLLG
jgi:hypothetical protein